MVTETVPRGTTRRAAVSDQLNTVTKSHKADSKYSNSSRVLVEYTIVYTCGVIQLHNICTASAQRLRRLSNNFSEQAIFRKMGRTDLGGGDPDVTRGGWL